MAGGKVFRVDWMTVGERDAAAFKPFERRILALLKEGRSPVQLEGLLTVTEPTLTAILSRMRRMVLEARGELAPDLTIARGLMASKDVPLSTVDVTPCWRCGLRGHLPGDPDRCLLIDRWATASEERV